MGREFLEGNEAIARAAIKAKCNFFAGYPITPATPMLLHMIRELPKVGGVAIQAEDEIAAIGFCIGASLSGSRAMTATSGPGISLFSENIGAAIMTEVPLVIVDVQRMGPATGGATTGGGSGGCMPDSAVASVPAIGEESGVGKEGCPFILLAFFSGKEMAASALNLSRLQTGNKKNKPRPGKAQSQSGWMIQPTESSPQDHHLHLVT